MKPKIKRPTKGIRKVSGPLPGTPLSGSQIPSEQAPEPLQVMLNPGLSAGGINSPSPAVEGKYRPDGAGGLAELPPPTTIKPPVWVIAGDPSNSRTGAAVFKNGRPVLVIDYCPWDKVHTGLFKCELNDLDISVQNDEDVLIVCEVPGHGAHFSRDQVNRSAGMLVDLVQFRIRGIDNLKKRVLYVPPVSWRKRLYGAALRGVEKKQWKGLAIATVYFLFGVIVGDDAAEALLQAYAYTDGYDFTKKKKKEPLTEPEPLLPNGKRRRGRPRKVVAAGAPNALSAENIEKAKEKIRRGQV